MPESPKVSVIIPVYNTESYLRQCLDSVINQTLREIEIICVDDGSTDSSLDILEEYATVDPRVTILRQHNQYAGVARNNGMAHATGKYLMFWDSDDYFDLTALEKMYNKCEEDKADICVCGVKRYYEEVGEAIVEPNYIKKSMIPDKIPFNRLTNEDYILNFTNAAPWNKMFSRLFVLNENLQFSPSKSANDVLFVEVALCSASAITLVQQPLINYRRNRVGSLTNTISGTDVTPAKIWIDTAGVLNELNIMPVDSFANRAITNLLYALRNQRNADSFKMILECLKGEALKQLHLDEPSRIRDEWQRHCLQTIIDGDADDVLIMLMNRSYFSNLKFTARNRLLKKQIAELEKQLKRSYKIIDKKDSEIEKIKASFPYKLSKVLASPIRSFRER